MRAALHAGYCTRRGWTSTLVNCLPVVPMVLVMLAVGVAVGMIQNGGLNVALNVAQWAAAISSLALGGGTLWMLRNDRRKRHVRLAAASVILMSASYVLQFFDFYPPAIALIHNIAVAALMAYLFIATSHRCTHCGD